MAIVSLIGEGLDTAMNKFNKTNAPKKEKPAKPEAAGEPKPKPATEKAPGKKTNEDI